jgi:hypothetical protein
MKNGLKIVILLIFPLIYGCGNEKNNNAEIFQHINDATAMYRNSGLLGLIDLSNSCYRNHHNNASKCVAYDYTGYFIDKGMSEVNKFPRDDYFKDVEIEKRIMKAINNDNSQQSLNLKSSNNIKRLVYEYLNGSNKQ